MAQRAQVHRLRFAHSARAFTRSGVIWALRVVIGASVLGLAAAPASHAQPEVAAPRSLPAEASRFRPIEFRDVPGWPGENVAAGLVPFLGTCRGLRVWAAERLLGGAGELARLGGRAAAYAGACDEAARLVDKLPQDDADGREVGARAFFERRFQAFAAAAPGLMTGYYEPELRGAEYPVGAFQTPLHAPPPLDSTEEGALPDRAAIEAGALAGMGLELAWVDDPVDAFFLHIQGSGRLRLHDGRLLRLGYAGQNGHPYRAIGRVLLGTGAIPRERMSMQAIRAWLATAGPGEAAATLRQNPSYVFFRALDGLAPDGGPPGALGVPLTPGRSLAVDPAFIPFGAPVFAETRDPLDGTVFRRLLHAQDTGGAIRGPARGDLFWGWGDAAATRAGLMREAAAVFVLVPRGGADEPETGAASPERRDPGSARVPDTGDR